jgi:emfourin
VVLSPDDAARAESALRDLPWERPAPEPGLPDQFRYEMATAEEGDNRSIILGEHEVPARLRPVLDLLTQHGQIRPASG